MNTARLPWLKKGAEVAIGRFGKLDEVARVATMAPGEARISRDGASTPWRYSSVTGEGLNTSCQILRLATDEDRQELAERVEQRRIHKRFSRAFLGFPSDCQLSRKRLRALAAVLDLPEEQLR